MQTKAPATILFFIVMAYIVHDHLSNESAPNEEKKIDERSLATPVETE